MTTNKDTAHVNHAQRRAAKQPEKPTTGLSQIDAHFPGELGNDARIFDVGEMHGQGLIIDTSAVALSVLHALFVTDIAATNVLYAMVRKTE